MTTTVQASAVERAKAVMAAHDRAANSGDLDAVMANIDDEIVALAPDRSLLEGRESFRAFYAEMLEHSWPGTGDVAHHFSGAEENGSVVVLHGVAKGCLRPPGRVPVAVANNFLILLKPDETGAYKIWRAAFSSAG